MEYDKINNLLRSEELESAVDSKSENCLNLLLGNMLKLIVYLIHIMKINQLDVTIGLL